jgi:hypothetical protein
MQRVETDSAGKERKHASILGECHTYTHTYTHTPHTNSHALTRTHTSSHILIVAHSLAYFRSILASTLSN